MYYTEIQHARDSYWTWVAIVVVSMAIFIPLGLALHQQIVLGIPWGSEPLSDQGLLAVSIAAIVFVATTVVMLSTSTYEVKIGVTGIQWRFTPCVNRWKTISTHSVQTVGFRRVKKWRAGAWGYNYNCFTRRRSMIVCASALMVVRTASGEELIFGTKHQSAMESAVRKMMQHVQRN